MAMTCVSGGKECTRCMVCVAEDREAIIDDEMCAAVLRDNESLILSFWWDNLTEEKEENAIKRAFYTMHEDDQIAAVKEAKRVYWEVLR